MNAQQDIDALLGGLESALARGQPLQKAMASFYNAGYEKKDIEEAARKFQQVHQRRFEELGVEPEPKKKIITPVSDYRAKPAKETKEISSEPKLKAYRSEMYSSQGGEETKKALLKKKDKVKKLPVVSRYGEDSVREAENFKEALIEAISSIKTVPVSQERGPQKVKPVVIQKVSDYSMGAPTPVSKAITFLLIFLLLLLLGLLGAVFFFKDELIELFNNLSIT